MENVRKNITLTKEASNLIDLYQKENNINTYSMAIDGLVKEYYKRESIENSIVNAIEEHNKKLFTRLRLGVSSTDKNVQVLIECLNAILFNMECKPMPTDVLETEVMSDSKKVVKERIAEFKQKNDWKNNKMK